MLSLLSRGYKPRCLKGGRRQVLIMGTMGMWVPTSGVLRKMPKNVDFGDH